MEFKVNRMKYDSKGNVFCDVTGCKNCATHLHKENDIKHAYCEDHHTFDYKTDEGILILGHMSEYNPCEEYPGSGFDLLKEMNLKRHNPRFKYHGEAESED